MTLPLGRALRMLRHVGAGQIVTRVTRLAERRWWRLTRAKAPVAAAPPRREHVPLWRELAVDSKALARAREIVAGQFTFLGETRAAKGWDARGASQLWRYHLHYFDYARDLAVLAQAGERTAAFRTFRERALSWIDAHQQLGGDAWHPYTVSLRIVNWCEAAMFFAAELDDDPAFAQRLVDSIATQARFLATHLETDVRGNHLLENARALIRAALFFDGAEPRRWLERGRHILDREIPEQILGDGGHFERAPGYHVRVMETLGDIATLLRENESAAPSIDDALARMRTFLAAIVPPNGRLPLFKDTVLPDHPIAFTAAQPSRWLASSGYAVMRDDARGDHLIADFGRVCPDYLPAHAHADLFSFELTIGGRPVIVDSGVYQYQGEWRNRFRATSAHNTVAVDGDDQSEMWGSFRVGRRARPRNVLWTEDAAFTAISGQHDGYAPRIHHRTIVALRDARIWVIADRVTGRGRHVAHSLLHLHPDAKEPAVTGFGGNLGETNGGWYSERFGAKRHNTLLVVETETPGWFGWVISARGTVLVTLTTEGDRAGIDIDALLSPWRASLALTPGEHPQLVYRESRPSP